MGTLDSGQVEVGNLGGRLSGSNIGVESLFQVIKAVEAAENIIRKQLEENNQLKDELWQKNQELEKYKSDATKFPRSFGSVYPKDEPTPTSYAMITLYPEDNMEHANAKIPNVSQKFPSSRTLSPIRDWKEGEQDQRIRSSLNGSLQTSKLISTDNNRKQDLLFKIREHEEEISQLKIHLSDFFVKEARIYNEKYTLEKRIAHMRMAFDQQQKDLVDAESKALSYRQDIIEENIRLTYALQEVQQERSTFIISLLPLLSEYGLQPPVHDANSIVGNLKILFKHIQAKLIITEEKLKESQYHIAPWCTDTSNASNGVLHSTSQLLGKTLIFHPQDLVQFEAISNPKIKNNLDIVVQTPHSHEYSPIASPSCARSRADLEVLDLQSLKDKPNGSCVENLDNGNNGSSPNNSAENKIDGSEAYGHQHELHDRESSLVTASGNSHNIAQRLDDQNLPSYLPPVLEVPISSISEEEDPLPAIEGLKIFGEAFPGREVQACGYSINGATNCNFEWVRHLENGSINQIKGAKNPVYFVTADDVNSHLAIEVQPMDNRNRKGEIIKVFANDERRITCDPQMQAEIDKSLSTGYSSYDLSISIGVQNLWEHAILVIKRETYNIKYNGPCDVMEKFSPNTEIKVSYEQSNEFSIQSGNGSECLLRTYSSNSLLRDTIVLILRLFKTKAIEKAKGKKKGFFFK
ncbi:hypothetical protein ZOSMA_155G00380 [Zostera marina]|uniref:Uncharacterized protein n=1 Tax=Zostera marina TaxID=29655 RepID=A0A0K9PXT5_ZOSMR|nr:hypothetical protein ZOSMA_155G00380 [Zostera marina]